tara:strand:- start:38 stop:415 length:378 start_codon:yes stop_codon:yes gene_type:complete
MWEAGREEHWTVSKVRSFVHYSSWGVARPPFIKTHDTPSLQSVTNAKQIIHKLKIFFRYIKTMTSFHRMQKNSGGQITSIEISNISGEYCAIIPEWIINEMGWYEDTKLSWKIDDENVIITETEE